MIVTVLDINRWWQVLNVKDIYVMGGGCSDESVSARTNTSVIAHKLQRFMLIGGRDFDEFHLSINMKYWHAVSLQLMSCES